MFLSGGKQDHDNQSHYGASGYDVLHHGYHSTGLAHYVVGDRAAKDDEHRGRSRQRAARPIEPGRPEAARRDMTPSGPSSRGMSRTLRRSEEEKLYRSQHENDWKREFVFDEKG
jgi:hypothetical protein